MANSDYERGASIKASPADLFWPESIRTAVLAYNAQKSSTAGTSDVTFSSTAGEVQGWDNFTIPKLTNTRSGLIVSE